jgi:hypothetical protein
MRQSRAGTTAAAAGGRPITSGGGFGNKHEAKSTREELRSLCPRNAKVIDLEPEQVDDNGARIWKGFTGFD